MLLRRHWLVVPAIVRAPRGHSHYEPRSRKRLLSAAYAQQQPVTEDIHPAQQPAAEHKKSAQQAVKASEKIAVTILEFEEVESGVEPFTTRMTISDRYIRIDDSGEAGQEGFYFVETDQLLEWGCARLF